MRSEETRGRPRYGPVCRPTPPLCRPPPSLNNDSLPRYDTFAIREKPTSDPRVESRFVSSGSPNACNRFVSKVYNCLVREQIVTIVFTTPLRSLSLSPPNTFPRRLYRRYRPIGFDRKDRSSRLLAYLLVSKKRGRRGRRFPAEDRSTCRFRTQPLFDVDSNPHGNDELSPWERKLASTIDVFVTYAGRGITNS